MLGCADVRPSPRDFLEGFPCCVVGDVSHDALLPSDRTIDRLVLMVQRTALLSRFEVTTAPISPQPAWHSAGDLQTAPLLSPKESQAAPPASPTGKALAQLRGRQWEQGGLVRKTSGRPQFQRKQQKLSELGRASCPARGRQRSQRSTQYWAALRARHRPARQHHQELSALAERINRRRGTLAWLSDLRA